AAAWPAAATVPTTAAPEATMALAVPWSACWHCGIWRTLSVTSRPTAWSAPLPSWVRWFCMRVRLSSRPIGRRRGRGREMPAAPRRSHVLNESRMPAPVATPADAGRDRLFPLAAHLPAHAAEEVLEHALGVDPGPLQVGLVLAKPLELAVGVLPHLVPQQLGVAEAEEAQRLHGQLLRPLVIDLALEQVGRGEAQDR